MSFFAILFALLLEQVRPLLPTNLVAEAARSWARTARKTLDAGKTPHGWLTWSAVVVLPAAVALLLHWGLVWALGWYGTLLVFAMHAAVLYVTLGFRQFSHHFTVIRDALEADNEALARTTLAQWKRIDASTLPKADLVRHVIEHSVLDAHRHVFGVLGWYAFLAALGLGPAGAIIYRLSEFAPRYYLRTAHSAGGPAQVSASLLAAAQQAWVVVDYLPARLTALGFAVVGNFEDAIDSWRSYAQRLTSLGETQESMDNDGIVLSATSGALNVRLGSEALKESVSAMDAQPFQADMTLPPGLMGSATNPLTEPPAEPIHQANAAREPTVAHLRSVVGLVWRSVVLWMLLLALLTLARLLG
jgi:adenosylcobinamide-phosphate synthase